MTPLKEAKRKLKRLLNLTGRYGSLDHNANEIREVIYELKDALDKMKED